MTNYSLIVFLFLSICLNAQEQKNEEVSNLLDDPYATIGAFNTFDVAFASQHVNSNNINFGDYTLKRGKYYPASSMGIYINIPNLFQMDNPYGKGKAMGNIKTGFIMDATTTDLYDNKLKEDLSFSQFSVHLPLLFSYRMPLNHGNEIGSKYFKAIHFNIGLYLGMPFSNRLYERGDITPKSNEWDYGDYMRWGYVVEFVYTALNKEGYGHRFGIRMMTDTQSVIKFNKEKYGIYPTYISTGLFYNIITIK